MSSKITLEITSLPLVGDFIEFQDGEQNQYRESFVVTRTGVGQSEIGNYGTLDDKLSYTIGSLLGSFTVDYNSTGQFTTFLDMITDPNSPPTLSITSDIDNFFTQDKWNDVGNNFTATFVNVPVVDPITVDSFFFVEASPGVPCTQVNAVATSSQFADSYSLDNINFLYVGSNPFTVPTLNRATSYLLYVRKGTQTSTATLISTPSYLVSADVSSSYVNSPSGATISIVVNPGLIGLNIFYSLNGTNFQSSSVFSGILEGDYTISVKDQLGCSTSIPITIPPFSDGGVGERTPYSDLPSKSNSIRYAKYVDWGVCSNYKNDENTLSWQLPYVENACEYKQLFQDCDNIITQIKTNYSSIVATVIDEELVETDATVTQKTFYTNLKDKRDARIYNIGGENLQTGIYFLSGNLYDYSTGADTGDYNLNGSLPAWGVIGNFTFYNNAWFLISNIIYDDSISAYVLVINTPYVGVDASIIVSSIYNLEPYNIFEFTVDMSLFQDKKIQVNITQTDDDVSFPSQVYLSEIIDVATLHEGTVCIDYYNDNNTDMFYGTGIKNKIRMPIEYFGGSVIDETTSERTDINTYLISAEGYESDNIAFKLMPKQMMRKVVQALAHKFVFLNDVQYVKEESPEVSGLIGTNLYRMNAPMTKANAVYTSRGTGEVFSTGTYEIPNLLKTESDGFLKIKK
tara:strand:+ start:1594 stop:3651 length:2058 start_codon:yes stop_codon:yes gene_type:complete